MCHNLISKCVYCGRFINQVDKPCDSRGRIRIRGSHPIDYCKRFGTFDGFGIRGPYELSNVHRPVKSGFKVALPVEIRKGIKGNEILVETRIVDKPLCLHSAREVTTLCYWCKDDAKSARDYEFMLARTGFVNDVVFKDKVSNEVAYLNRKGKFCYLHGRDAGGDDGFDMQWIRYLTTSEQMQEEAWCTSHPNDRRALQLKRPPQWHDAIWPKDKWEFSPCHEPVDWDSNKPSLEEVHRVQTNRYELTRLVSDLRAEDQIENQAQLLTWAFDSDIPNLAGGMVMDFRDFNADIVGLIGETEMDLWETPSGPEPDLEAVVAQGHSMGLDQPSFPAPPDTARSHARNSASASSLPSADSDIFLDSGIEISDFSNNKVDQEAIVAI